jgi:hypothetical protein
MAWSEEHKEAYGDGFNPNRQLQHDFHVSYIQYVITSPERWGIPLEDGILRATSYIGAIHFYISEGGKWVKVHEVSGISN